MRRRLLSPAEGQLRASLRSLLAGYGVESGVRPTATLTHTSTSARPRCACSLRGTVLNRREADSDTDAHEHVSTASLRSLLCGPRRSSATGELEHVEIPALATRSVLRKS
jgi:hypothetical protein